MKELQGTGKSVSQQFAENLRVLTEGMITFAEAAHSMANFASVSQSALERFKPYLLYAAADYPLGKSMRGFKKWSKHNS